MDTMLQELLAKEQEVRDLIPGCERVKVGIEVWGKSDRHTPEWFIDVWVLRRGKRFQLLPGYQKVGVSDADWECAKGAILRHVHYHTTGRFAPEGA
jgi:hypothetical protein